MARANRPRSPGSPGPAGSGGGQLDLFGGAAAGPVSGVAPAEIAREIAELRAKLPSTLRMGTSSWSFPGWAGIVYRDTVPQARLARDGLAAYARHPLFRSVGVDRTHYAPVPASVLADYAAVVPDDFRFLAKAHEACTLAAFPGHPRYGQQRGQANPLFLDPGHARDLVVAPFVEGFGAKGGPLLFQFAPQPESALGTPGQFAASLHRFLGALPRGPLYAVEIRNGALLTRDYAAALADVGAVHCVNLLPGMPPPGAQWRMTGRADAPLVVRWLLARHLAYEDAKSEYEPFNQLVDPDPGARAALVAMVKAAHRKGLQSWLIVNNKAEGSSPLSVLELARGFAEEDEVPF
jgi:uncharacterized protein YecE (DUF72 family)